MLTGIELMLKRMETHPEEFVGENGGCTREWYRAFHNVAPHLTDEERKAVDDALVKAYREFFNGEAMRIMAGKAEEDGEVTASMRRSLRDLLDNRDEQTEAGSILSGIGASTGTFNTLTYNPNYVSKKVRIGAAVAKAEGMPVSYE
jgi:hypothetical protein